MDRRKYARQNHGSDYCSHPMGKTVVRMGKGMRMLMLVTVAQRIAHHKHRAGDHHQQRSGIPKRQFLFQKNKGQKRADKRSERIVGAGFCCAQCFLRTDIGIVYGRSQRLSLSSLCSFGK